MATWKEPGFLVEGEEANGEKIITIDCGVQVCMFLELNKQMVIHNAAQSYFPNKGKCTSRDISEGISGQRSGGQPVKEGDAQHEGKCPRSRHSEH